MPSVTSKAPTAAASGPVEVEPTVSNVQLDANGNVIAEDRTVLGEGAVVGAPGQKRTVAASTTVHVDETGPEGLEDRSNGKIRNNFPIPNPQEIAEEGAHVRGTDEAARKARIAARVQAKADRAKAAAVATTGTVLTNTGATGNPLSAVDAGLVEPQNAEVFSAGSTAQNTTTVGTAGHVVTGGIAPGFTPAQSVTVDATAAAAKAKDASATKPA